VRPLPADVLQFLAELEASPVDQNRIRRRALAESQRLLSSSIRATPFSERPERKRRGAV
jgi:hypothetical protein